MENLSAVITTGRGPLTAVDGVSLSLDRGEVLGIVGESGSGKSVLARTIMGLHCSDPRFALSGTVKLDGRDVLGLEPSQLRAMWGPEVGMVFQDPMTALNPVKRVGTHLVEAVRKHQQVTRRDAVGQALDLLDMVGIPDPRRRINQFPHQLSGGMRQRVVIAMALANRPKLLIADEPTTALDVTVQRQILDLLDRLRGELGMAVIMISHDLGVVAGRTDRVAVMYGGEIVETADARSLFDAPRHPYASALLAAIPSLKGAPHQRLAAIDGTPPDLVMPPSGCRFAARCDAVHDDCRVQPPQLIFDGTHGTACHYPVNPLISTASNTSGDT
ncbi:ABC transporter ATP-binding protein [Pimelobacter simplex]|uniref:ABC transporter ATP-binding protein n=1 Tax=Nocardioides simplex TaxID=2045 RepID=UPI0027DB7A2D